MQSPSSDTNVAKPRACGNCSRAKAKCISQFDDSSSQQCARCFRLKKECFIQPRAKRKKRAPNSSGTAELEAKIESLVNLLSAAQPAKPRLTEDHGTPGRPLQPSYLSTGFCSRKGATTPPIKLPQNYTSLETASMQNSITPIVKSPDEFLRTFRDQFMVQFPYAIISPNVTAVELRDKHPWLYRMIMMATSSHERRNQTETGKLLISELSTAMLTGGEKSLDMLQALLVYASWSHYFAAVLPHAQSNGVMQLVLALVYDLALNRVVRYDGETAAFFVEFRRKIRGGDYTNAQEGERSLDECRALLYAFYLSSTLSSCHRKSDGLPFSPHMDYSCKTLQESSECEADLILVACVRFQSIADFVHKTLPNRPSHSDGRNAPMWMHTDHLQLELQTTFNSLSSDIQSHVITRLSYHSVETFLSEAAMLETWNAPTYNSRRIDLRWSSLMASKSLLDAFLTLPLSAYHAVPYPILAQVAFCLMNLFKLAFVEDPGWDLDHVRETVHLASYFETLASRAEQVGTAIDSAQNLPTKESFPTLCARAMTWGKGWYDTMVASEREARRLPGQQPPGMAESSFDIPNYNTFDYMDENYWQELVAEFNDMPMQPIGPTDTV